MLTGQELKDDAVAILENLYPEIEIAFYQSGNHDMAALDGAKAAIDQLQMHILSTKRYPNPRYWKASDLAAELVHFSYRHPEAFAEMFGECDAVWCRDMDVRTAEGLESLAGFYRLMCDDHSFSLDTTEAVLLVKCDWQFDHPVGLVGIEPLLDAMQRHRLELEIGSADVPSA